MCKKTLLDAVEKLWLPGTFLPFTSGWKLFCPVILCFLLVPFLQHSLALLIILAHVCGSILVVALVPVTGQLDLEVKNSPSYHPLFSHSLEHRALVPST